MNWQRIRFYFRQVTTQDIDNAIASTGLTGDWLHVLWLCDRYLSKHPEAVSVVLARARCHQAMNHPEKFKTEVALAFALDDTFVPAIYYQVGIFVEEKRTSEALTLLALIKDHAAVRDGVDTLLSELCMRRAQADAAREYQLRSWMANFDHIRHANGYLFRLTYVDVNELEVAQEHQFWAQTMLPFDGFPASRQSETLVRVHQKLALTPKQTQALTVRDHRIRIAYWGGDFKEHSVRYFFRPLLESHNREQFEVFIYDENFMNGSGDQHTAANKAHSDYFFDISHLTDEEVCAFIESHQIDILVEVQGHTSSNRLHLWQKRFAPLQITGLAYPPTTGLASIDYKMVDIHMVSPGSSAYYAERQLVLPHSFWCFDPKEEAPFTTEPPHLRKGYITLGCLGNAAKITLKIMAAWRDILLASPTTRLLVLSHTFGDSITEDAFRGQLKLADVPENQVICSPAVPRDELWLKYQEVDMVLDTFPFNGGTTSCWATYAGVPVLTLAGNSLASCMGKSIMCNLGFPEFVANDLNEYTAKAIELLKNPAPMGEFRSVARARFLESSLGNGSKFAAEFEQLCTELLDQRRQGLTPGIAPAVTALPLAEMLRRARMVWYHGNADACERILRVCRDHYGNDPAIVEYEAESLLGRQRFEAFDEVCSAAEPGYPALWHLQAQAAIARGANNRARELVQNIVHQPLAHELTAESGHAQHNRHLQQQLWQAWLNVTTHPVLASKPVTTDRPTDNAATQTVLVLVVGRDPNLCQVRAEALKLILVDPECTVSFQCCHPFERIEVLNQLLGDACESQPDVVVVLRDHVDLGHPGFLSEIRKTLAFADVVSPGGALRWTQKDWAQDLPAHKAWGLMRPSHLAGDLYELHFAGNHAQKIITDAVVLDGQLLAFVPARVAAHSLDEEMGGAGYWAEEDWCNRIHHAGGQLAIHRTLGVVLHPSAEAQSLHTTHGQASLLKRLGLDPMHIPHADHSIQTVQVSDPSQGVQVAIAYLNE